MSSSPNDSLTRKTQTTAEGLADLISLKLWSVHCDIPAEMIHLALELKQKLCLNTARTSTSHFRDLCLTSLQLYSRRLLGAEPDGDSAYRGGPLKLIAVKWENVSQIEDRIVFKIFFQVTKNKKMLLCLMPCYITLYSSTQRLALKFFKPVLGSCLHFYTLAEETMVQPLKQYLCLWLFSSRRLPNGVQNIMCSLHCLLELCMSRDEV